MMGKSNLENLYTEALQNSLEISISQVLAEILVPLL